MLNQLIKSQAPKLKSDLNKQVEEIMNGVAEEKELSPFDLSLCFTREGDKAVGRIFDKEQNCLEELDAGELITDLFKIQLEVIPPMFKKMVMDKLDGNDDIDSMVVDALEDRSVLIEFNEEFNLEYFQITIEGATPIDIGEFFANLEI